ncbi:hypothetical protein PanWU01x14_261980 [Parasponia andersonii]|uniref:Uncharacterized protein n=1 Tax=Parasponia andersonii TaxID=3476 RepID=A0A2P5B8G5_PARAD|nr:hypothetical protein PanWU01x14_261980 [Parasponia andersonii]
MQHLGEVKQLRVGREGYGVQGWCGFPSFESVFVLGVLYLKARKQLNFVEGILTLSSQIFQCLIYSSISRNVVFI